MDILLQCVNINTLSMLYKELRVMINGHHILLLLRDCGNFTQRCYIYTGVYAKVINLSLGCVFLFEYFFGQILFGGEANSPVMGTINLPH